MEEEEEEEEVSSVHNIFLKGKKKIQVQSIKPTKLHKIEHFESWIVPIIWYVEGNFHLVGRFKLLNKLSLNLDSSCRQSQILLDFYTWFGFK